MQGKRIWFADNRIYLETDTGQVGSLPLKAFPLLNNATEQQRQEYELTPFGIHWEKLDEDLSFEGFFTQQERQDNEVARVLKAHPEINVSQLARRIGINQSLMAKYVCGIANPSPERLKQIEEALHELGKELSSVSLCG